MKRLKILIWHIHGSYLNALGRIEHDWYLPTKPERPTGYGGRGRTFDMPQWVREVPADQIADLDLDLVIYQTPTNLLEDGPEILSPRQRSLPAIYLEHNTPRPEPVNSRHPAADLPVLIVHVTHYNQLMWDNGSARSCVIEHSVGIDPDIRYDGSKAAGISITNNMHRRPRHTGFDLFQSARQSVPLDLAGMGSEELGGLGDIPYRDLHRRIASYRFLFSPMRYTSLPLAVIEAMTIGMPVVALATTELPTVIEDGISGYLSCDPDVLIDRMRLLLSDAPLARRLGDAARKTAQARFGLDRFARDWNRTFALAIDLHQSPTSDLSGASAWNGSSDSRVASTAVQP